MRKNREIGEKIGVYLLSALVFLWILFPIYYMVTTSFKTYSDIWYTSYLPQHPTIENYVTVVTQSYFRVEYFWTWVWNSVRIALGIVALSLLISLCTGYVLSHRIVSRIKESLRSLTLLAYMFPASLLSIPLFQLMTAYNLVGTDISLILALSTLVTPYNSWIMAEYFNGIPKEIDEAAYIDGASRITVFTRILLPIALPAIIAVMTYSFMYSWNNYLYALIFLGGERSLTLPVAMGFFLSTDDSPWNIFMTVGIIYSIPPVLFYYLFKRYLVSGLFRGAVKI